jgi:hypothetical protein
VGAGRVIDVRHEAVIADPKGALKEMCAFLGVTPSDEYLEACAGIVYASPHRSRLEAPWSPELKDAVQRRIDGFAFLEGYGWDD